VGLDTTAALLARFGRKQIRVRLAAPIGPSAGAAAPGLPAWLIDLGATVDDSGRIVTCPLGAGSPAALLARLATLDPPVADIDTEQPSLEQVFLALTGDGAGAVGR
jgi:hypothetical protein